MYFSTKKSRGPASRRRAPAFSSPRLSQRKTTDSNGRPAILAGRCGEREIRTPETLSSLSLFESGAFNHSAISPYLYTNDQNYTKTVPEIALKI